MLDAMTVAVVPLPASEDNCILFPLRLIVFFKKKEK